VGVEVQAAHVVSTDTGRGSLFSPSRDEYPGYLLSLLKHHVDECFGRLSVSREGLGPPFSISWGWGNHRLFSGVWLEKSGYYLKLFCLPWLPLSWSSARGKLLVFFVSVLIGVSQLLSSEASRLGYMRPKQNPGKSMLCYFLGQEGSISFVPFLYFSES
jgi:hypothetical protein